MSALVFCYCCLCTKSFSPCCCPSPLQLLCIEDSPRLMGSVAREWRTTMLWRTKSSQHFPPSMRVWFSIATLHAKFKRTTPPPKKIIACSQLSLLDMPWIVATLVCAILPKLLLFAHVRIEKRAKYSRRRAYNDDADIDYINERNAKFNKKAERFYGKYTAEIKQNLERGTAV